jgi:AcrR family transcriptional regulator
MPSPRTRQTQSERRAESARRLMDAAIELIAEKGLEKTSAMEIADRAGYSHGMVAARYGSKEALLERIMREEYEPRMLPPQDVPTGLPRLQAWIDQLRAEVTNNPLLIKSFWTLVFETPGPITSLRPWATTWIERCIYEAHACIQSAQRAGDLPDTIDAHAEAELFVFSGIGSGFRFALDSNIPAFDHVISRWSDRLAALTNQETDTRAA